MARIHLALQGKGGVGKSLISSMLAQHFTEVGRQLRCVDTDPVNATFSQYQALGVTHISILDGNRVNERHFDQLMELLLTDTTTEEWVIDNGASSFIPLSSYLVENQGIEMLQEAGHEVVIHTVITGGQGLRDTLTGFKSLATQLPGEAGIVVWLNEYFGPIQADGRSFEQMKVYTENKSRVRGIVTLRQQNRDTFGRDVEDMLNARQTVEEAIGSNKVALMAKQRLQTFRRGLWQQLAVVMG